jgi:hypothetical protein
MIAFLWGTFYLAFIFAAGPIILSVSLILMARRHPDGTDLLYGGLGLLLGALACLCTLVGGGAGLWLAAVLPHSTARTVIATISGIVLGLDLIIIALTIQQLMARRRSRSRR